MKQTTILELLGAGDVREQSGAIATEVLRHNDRFVELLDAIASAEEAVAQRAAALADSITRNRPDLLVAHRARLIDEIGPMENSGVRRAAALMIPRVKLGPKERSRAVALFERYMQSEDDTVVLAGLTALGDLATDDAMLRKRVTHVVARYAQSGTPALQARAQKILQRFEMRAASAKPRSDASPATKRGRFSP